MKGRHWCLVLGLALLLAWAPGCRKWCNWCGVNMVQFTQTSGQEAAGAEVTKLVVANRVGDVRVIGDSPSEVRVEAVVKLNEDLVAVTDKGAFPDHVKVTVAGDTIKVEDAHTGQPDEKNWAVSMVLHVPPRLALKVTNGVGDVIAKSTSSDVHLTSGVGDVTAEVEQAGEVKVTTGVGDVRLVAQAVSGALSASSGTGTVDVKLATGAMGSDVVLASGTGDLRLALPAGSPGVFTLTTGVGSVTITGHDGIKKSGGSASPSKSAKGTIGTGGPKYTLKTGVGSITLE